MRAILLSIVGVKALMACSMSAEGQDPPASGNLATDVVEDIKEAGEGFVSFIQQEGAIVTTAVENAASWLKSKLAELSTDAAGVLTGAIQQGQASGGSLGEIVANTLDILYNDAHAIWAGVDPAVKTEVQAVDSSVITAAASLTSVVPKV